MEGLDQLHAWIRQPTLATQVESAWAQVTAAYEKAQRELPAERAMARKELSFHEQVKLLGYLCRLVDTVQGDVVEIGVWKGKSLAFMASLSRAEKRIVGIDPLELPNQPTELAFFHERIMPNTSVIQGYSELSLATLLSLTRRIALLHIDGGHLARIVILDFLLYSPFMVPGGFIVFDDYRDIEHSPEVGPAVDLLRSAGLFKGFDVFGPIEAYPSSYVLRRR